MSSLLLRLKKEPTKPMIIIALIWSFVWVYLIFHTIAATTYVHTFSISPLGGGTVKNVSTTYVPSGTYTRIDVDCPSDCVNSFYYSATEKLAYKAYPTAGYRFVGWEASPSVRSGIDYSANPIYLSKTSSRTLSARFAKLTELEIAQGIVDKYIKACPILAGTTVVYMDSPSVSMSQYQAVTFFSSSRIELNRDHTTSVERIMNHEIYHVYDYRDNGRIDWGESIPPNPKPSCVVKAGL